ncbi:hypothetical protein DUNSADRAFT_758 [Dunaliella salina]|uniref:Uncharacterized protein n=1 Tax=Dunaliella salina TaxID=3046 RepID=A0ABQ7FYG8_DUNSA|nr:hypothetical protein DUNSADRAFT_758 [Dunaliella salina]|eukprot:KAF5827393.1 hypothetical protein DUNSADRAFT_758 [Dunaliella salina]
MDGVFRGKHVEALERELFASNSQATQQQQQQQQQPQPHGLGDGLPSTSSLQGPSVGVPSHQGSRPHKHKKDGRQHLRPTSQQMTDDGLHPVSSHQHDGHEQQQQVHQQQQQQQQHESSNQGQGDSAAHIVSARRRQRPPGKQMSKTQRLALENEVRKAQAEKTKQEAQQARAEHQAKVEQSKKVRGKEKQKFFKKTKKGQPVMKYRMDKVLAALQKQHQ